MKWHKLGRLFEPAGSHPKLLTHAANPLPLQVQGNIYRIFYSGRDVSNRSSIAWVDFDIDARTIARAPEEPAFVHGPSDSFYSHGVSIGNCYGAGDRRYMLFMGWAIRPNEHWRGEIGRLAVGRDLDLRLANSAPILGLGPADPISLSYPWIEPQDDGSFRMWYGSTETWDAGNGEMLHPIKAAISDDGEIWRRTGLAIPYQLGVAQAFSRPTIIVDKTGQYHAWFSYRGMPGRTYRIGHAVSQQGERWELQMDNGALDVSPQGWDSEMVEYPYVFRHGSSLYMLYNGNGFGKSGFGLAILDREF